MGRGPSAYFIFCGEKRAEARTYVEAAAEPGQKISVATVAKRLGELWKALTDEEKQGYTLNYNLYSQCIYLVGFYISLNNPCITITCQSDE